MVPSTNKFYIFQSILPFLRLLSPHPLIPFPQPLLLFLIHFHPQPSAFTSTLLLLLIASIIPLLPLPPFLHLMSSSSSPFLLFFLYLLPSDFPSPLPYFSHSSYFTSPFLPFSLSSLSFLYPSSLSIFMSIYSSSLTPPYFLSFFTFLPPSLPYSFHLAFALTPILPSLPLLSSFSHVYSPFFFLPSPTSCPFLFTHILSSCTASPFPLPPSYMFFFHFHIASISLLSFPPVPHYPPALTPLHPSSTPSSHLLSLLYPPFLLPPPPFSTPPFLHVLPSSTSSFLPLLPSANSSKRGISHFRIIDYHKF